MRGVFRFIGLLIAAAIIAALAIFAAQNISGIPVRFLGPTFPGNIWWISAGSAVLGFVLAFLLLAPGRVAAGWRGRTLGREQARLRDELAVVRAREAYLRDEHEQLRAQHAQVSAERDQLRHSAAPGTASATPDSVAQDAPGSASAAPAPLIPPARPVGIAAYETGAAADHPPTLGERLRGAFNRPARPQPDATSGTSGATPDATPSAGDPTQAPPVPTA